MAIVRVENLRKSYHSAATHQQVFDALSLSIERGEILALLGESGSGKTTLLNLISGIDSPDAGAVWFDNVPLHRTGEPARTLLRRERIGFVFQFFNLIPTLTVGENIALPLELLGLEARTARAQVAAILEDIGLVDMGRRYPETLSGGEQQRAAIARALVHRPSLLLADEPTGNLDEGTGRRIVHLLITLARRHGTTMLLVTHSGLVADAADRVLRLRQGRVAGD
ncbi:MAG: ABC transporter ATP-binding protein [Gammaproteobacteria bacterium]|jgi:putative ABC transport system ATP-binding protein